jgi:SAM-dependent methyltransferase
MRLLPWVLAMASIRKVMFRVSKYVSKQPDAVGFWEQRAQRLGRRAVLNIAHGEGQFDGVTEAQWKIYRGVLDDMKYNGVDRILDFGCGVGRFAERLTAYGKDVVGADISAALLAMAPKKDGVRYVKITPGVIPFPDRYFDMVWIALVLGGIVDDQKLAATAVEINRVLVQGGILFLAEHIGEGPGVPHWRTRPEEEYIRLFPNMKLSIATVYEDAGLDVSVLVGHKLPLPQSVSDCPTTY